MKNIAISVACLLLGLVVSSGCSDGDGGETSSGSGGTAGSAQCTPKDRVACTQGVTYWLDSCGDQGDVAEICDCGCNSDFSGCDQDCSCTAECDGKVCGDDGCGATCGSCSAGESCTTAGQCMACTADCAGKVCGDDGCGGLCGTCNTGEACDTSGQCMACTADCSGKVCGDDGCGASCGSCTGTGETCNSAGQCVTGCTPDCSGKVCGDDGCSGSCGSCTGSGETCSAGGQCQGSSSDLLTLANCAVPYVLDASKVGDITYMTSHFADLTQQYCITGSYEGADIAAFPEKMFYGQHDAGNTVSLVQLSMDGALAPQWSVRIDFSPDSSFTSGSSWRTAIAGLDPLEARVGLIRHLGTNGLCIKAIGTAGIITASSANNCTAVEGGSFTISGTAQLTNPWDLSDYCSMTQPSLPCCT